MADRSARAQLAYRPTAPGPACPRQLVDARASLAKLRAAQQTVAYRRSVVTRLCDGPA